MRRSGQPSRPSAMTCCRFSSLKTLLTSMEGNPSIVLNVLPDFYWPVFSCPSLAGFGCPPRIPVPSSVTAKPAVRAKSPPLGDREHYRRFRHAIESFRRHDQDRVSALLLVSL